MAFGFGLAAQGAGEARADPVCGCGMTLKSQSSRPGGAEGSVNVTRSRVLMLYVLAGQHSGDQRAAINDQAGLTLWVM